VLNKHCYKAKLIRIQRVINIRTAKAYRTVSNEELCVIAGIKPIHIKMKKQEDTTKLQKEREFSMTGKWK